VIFGVEGFSLNYQEIEFFNKIKPYGFILFSRNIDNPDQVKSLTSQLRDLAGPDCAILIDQEGGRVARLRPPYWKEYPPMSRFAQMAQNDLEKAKYEVFLNYQNIGKDLYELGINVDCAPVCDLIFDGAHDIVGDRSFGSDVTIVSALARSAAEGLLSSKVTPIIKHIPGHGRAKADSHKELPKVDCTREDLFDKDFKVFKNLCDMPWAMTAHILYSDIDPENPATLSKKIIDLIRVEIGFSGIIVTDDLSMEALEGSYAQRTIKALNAGCDIILHCNGNIDQMQQIASAIADGNYDKK
jgi:beta-N-acetylhexosaminidase